MHLLIFNKDGFCLRYAKTNSIVIYFFANLLWQLLCASISTQIPKTSVSQRRKFISMHSDFLAKKSNDKGADAGQATKVLAS